MKSQEQTEWTITIQEPEQPERWRVILEGSVFPLIFFLNFALAFGMDKNPVVISVILAAFMTLLYAVTLFSPPVFFIGLFVGVGMVIVKYGVVAGIAVVAAAFASGWLLEYGSAFLERLNRQAAS